MANTLVIGASGQIGRQLVTMLKDAGHGVTAMVRDRRKGGELGLDEKEIVVGDLEQDFSHAFENCDSVVFTAGSGAKTGADKTILVDLWGARKAVDFAKAAGVKQFVMVSSRGAADPDRGPAKIKHYTVAKHFADEYLKSSGLAYTILRPGRLLNEAGNGLVRATRPDDPEAQIIPREDVAKAIVHCLNNTTCIGKIYELYSGDQSIEAALGSTE